MKYDFLSIEKKWQDKWDEEKAFKAENSYEKPKYYALVEFPYPSGQGLHVGHPRPYTALDIISRKKRMQGYNVLFPMGWDAFGLPTLKAAWPTLKEQIREQIIPFAELRENLRLVGAPYEPEHIGVSRERFRKTFSYIPYMYTA